MLLFDDPSFGISNYCIVLGKYSLLQSMFRVIGNINLFDQSLEFQIVADDIVRGYTSSMCRNHSEVYLFSLMG